MSVAPIIGAFIQADASKKASRVQAEASREAGEKQLQAIQEAIAEERRQFDVTQEQIEPFRQVGLENLETLAELNRPGEYLAEEFGSEDFEADPGYQFRLSEGLKALDRSAASRGQLLSGRQLKDLGRFGQGMASDEYGRAYNRFQTSRGTRFNRLAALAGVGQTATNTLADLGAQTSGRVGQATIAGGQAQANALINAANARASGYMGVANAWAQGLTQSEQNTLDMISQFGSMAAMGV
jgi:hypothetical protein